MLNAYRTLSQTTVAGLIGTMCLVLAGCPNTTTNKGTDGGSSDGGGGSCAPGTVPQIEASCVCQASVDCEAGNSANWACTPANSCIQICTGENDPTCASPNVCEDLICRPPACGDNSECTNGQTCIGGSCQAPVTTVTSCAVTPGSAVLNGGGTKTFWAVGYNSSGAAVPYEGAVTWGATPAASATTTSTTSTANFTASTTLAAGAGTITATIGSTTCTPATVQEYAAETTAGTVRVVVTDLTLGTPIAGATVTADTNTASTGVTGADGSTTFTLAAGKHNYNVFFAGYVNTVVVGTVATDIHIPIKGTAALANFNGELASTNFNNVSDPEGTLHLDISGASVAGNLIDLSLTTLLGPSQPVTISLGTATSYGPFNLPEGIALGLGPSMFGPGGRLSSTAVGGDYGIVATPGYRALWSLGGNAVIGNVLQAIGPVLNGGTGSISSDIPTILTAILPILGSLESGVTSGVLVTPGENAAGAMNLTYGTTGTATMPALSLDTLMRLHLNVKTPPLSAIPTGGTVLQSYLGDSSATATFNTPVAFNGAIVLGGTLTTPQGLVPLGLTAGVDATPPTGSTQAVPAMTNPSTPAYPAGHLPMRVAPRHGGIEVSPWCFVTLGASLTSLVGGLTGGSDGGSSGAPSETILAGHVTFVPSNAITYTNGGVAGADFNLDLSKPFLQIPENAANTIPYSVANGITTPTTEDATAVFNRLDIGSGAGEWSVYFPSQMAGVKIALPTAPTGFTAPAVGAKVVLNSVSLGYNAPGATSAETYDGIWAFDGIDADDLTHETDNFSSREMVPAGD